MTSVSRMSSAPILPKGTPGSDNLLGGSFLKHFVYRMDLTAGVVKLSHIPKAEDDSTDDDATDPKAATPAAANALKKT